MLKSETEKLLHLEEDLHKRVIGQNEAVSAIADAVRRNRSGLSDENRPIGSFLFLGTTGVGKTELAKALAEMLFNDEKLLTRIDMSEYQERHAVSRLVGAPPGYVGYDEGGQLTEAVRRKPYSVILLDEIEKAHPDVFNILLQVLEDGRLTDNKGRVANFKNCIIIMTSNLGSEIIQANFENPNGNTLEKVKEIAKKEVLILMKQTMRPEFINRIDEVILFSPLTKNNIKHIVNIQLDTLTTKLKEQDFDITFAPELIEYIIQNGYDFNYGARPIKRLIQKEILNKLSKLILGNQLVKNEKLILDIFENEVVVRKVVKT
jgi:ATP-dependent Clp protease ATP-binding subunit ClpB